MNPKETFMLLRDLRYGMAERYDENPLYDYEHKFMTAQLELQDMMYDDE